MFYVFYLVLPLMDISEYKPQKKYNQIKEKLVNWCKKFLYDIKNCFYTFKTSQFDTVVKFNINRATHTKKKCFFFCLYVQTKEIAMFVCVFLFLFFPFVMFKVISIHFSDVFAFAT